MGEKLRITWVTPSRTTSTKRGRVNGMHLFTLSVPLSGVGRELRTTLPLLSQRLGTFATADEAKQHAEKVLEDFVKQLGAEFTDPA